MSDSQERLKYVMAKYENACAELAEKARQADELAAALESVLHDYVCAIDSMEFEEEADESRELYADAIQTLTNYSKSKGE